MKRTSFLFLSALISLSVFAQTDVPNVPNGWHLLDKQTSGYYGISASRAYDFVKEKKLKSKTVIVAVIDSGVDTTHEDLKAVLWTNPGEIPGNGIDDDKNGYVDDIHGWDFLGGRDGKIVDKDSYEAARVYHQYKAKWDAAGVDTVNLSKDDKIEFEMWKRAKADVVGGANPLELIQYRSILKTMMAGDSVIKKDLKKDEYNCKDLANYTTQVPSAQKTRDILIGICKENDNQDITSEEIIDELSGDIAKLEAAVTPPEDFRGEIVKDNYADFNDKFYGNSNVLGSNKAALHGTHVSGIIAADHNNGLGMDGVADNVRIMMVRAVPDGDEHDKDIALAIRYAVDNGAEVINMSFGKGFSPQKKWVDEAVQYAQSKGVLLVHAAGNDHENNDSSFNFPCPVYQADGKRATNWITVGASGDPKAGGLVASFSNYGKKEVDVFAPGVKIYSSVPAGNAYQNLQGTSMASPVVAGLAAFILEYYPNLSAEQVKMVIEKSAQKPTEKVINPGTGEEVSLSDICKTGGIVNAYEAIKLASTLKGERNKVAAPAKSIVKPKAKG